MTRTQRVLLVTLGAAALFVAALAFRTRKPPFLPADADHGTFVSGQVCLTCHGPDGPSPQSRRHPLGNECMRCHATR